MPTDELLRKILARDRSALYQFYRTYTPRLERRIRAKIAVPQDAEEVLQDTLMAFLESLRDFQGRAKIETFLYAICQHKIIDYYRKRKLKQILFSQAPQLETLISPLVGPEEALDSGLLKEKIQTVLKKLLPQYRTILLFKYLDGLSVGEIAQKLTITFKSAESQLFRARKAFVEIFLSI